VLVGHHLRPQVEVGDVAHRLKGAGHLQASGEQTLQHNDNTTRNSTQLLLQCTLSQMFFFMDDDAIFNGSVQHTHSSQLLLLF
jgi:hypothetical protein